MFKRSQQTRWQPQFERTQKTQSEHEEYDRDEAVYPGAGAQLHHTKRPCDGGNQEAHCSKEDNDPQAKHQRLFPTAAAPVSGLRRRVLVEEE